MGKFLDIISSSVDGIGMSQQINNNNNRTSHHSGAESLAVDGSLSWQFSRQSLLTWSRSLLSSVTFILVPNVLAAGRRRVEQGGSEQCLRIIESLGDLNRDYSVGWKKASDGSAKDHPFHAWQTRIIAQIAEREQPAIFTNFHSGEFSFYYPFDHIKQVRWWLMIACRDLPLVQLLFARVDEEAQSITCPSREK